MVGFFGNDVFVDDYAYGGSFQIRGEDGDDILRLENGQSVDFSPFSSSVSSINKIDLLTDGSANTITLGYADVLNMSDDGTLYIDGAVGDSVSGGADAGMWTLMDSDDVYNYYTLGTATLAVDMDISHDLVGD
jgi:hypothetical protein